MSVETDRIEADLNESRSRLNSTLEELGNKLSPGQIADEVVGFARGQASEVISKVGTAVKNNPLPTLLIASGIALLVFQNRKRSSSSGVSADDWSSDRRYRTLEEARWATPRMPNETDDAYNDRVHQAYAKALNLSQKAGEAMHEFKARVASAADSLKHTATGARDRIGRAFSGAAHFASDTAHTVSEKAKAGAEYVGQKASAARHSAEDFYDENPLAVGALAVAVGAVVGSFAPLTQPEREGLRGVADTAARKGADFAERSVRKVEERVDGALH